MVARVLLWLHPARYRPFLEAGLSALSLRSHVLLDIFSHGAAIAFRAPSDQLSVPRPP